MLRNRRKKSFRFEALESRAMLAVTTSFTDGNLLVTGDGLHDNIAVTGDIATGRITITGLDDSEGNPTLINGVANDSVSFSPVYGDLSISNAIGGFQSENSVTLDDVYISGALHVGWFGTRSEIKIAGNAPVYAATSIQFGGAASESLTINASNATVYSLGDINVYLDESEVNTLISSTIQGNQNVRFHLSEGASHETPNAQTANATITNVWAGEDITVYSFAANTNVSLTQSSAVDEVLLNNRVGVETVWSVAYVFATTNFDISADGVQGSRFNPGPGEPTYTPYFNPGTGTVSTNVQFSAAQKMTIKGNGALNSTTLYSNSVTGSEGISVIHILDNAAQDGSTIDMSYNVVSSGTVNVQMSRADDSLTMTGNYIFGATTLDGEMGTNILKRRNNLFNGPITITNFTEN